MDAKRGAKMRNYSSTLERWQKVEKDRISQMGIIRTEVYRRYLDYLTKIDISHEAAYSQGSRHESTINMQSIESNLQTGPMKKERRPSIGDVGIDGNSTETEKRNFIHH